MPVLALVPLRELGRCSRCRVRTGALRRHLHRRPPPRPLMTSGVVVVQRPAAGRRRLRHHPATFGDQVLEQGLPSLRQPRRLPRPPHWLVMTTSGVDPLQPRRLPLPPPRPRRLPLGMTSGEAE